MGRKLDSVKLNQVCTIIAGQSPSSETYNSEGIGIPFFQGKTDFGITSPTIRMYCSEPIKIAEPGDILISVRAPVGPTNLCNTKSCIGRGLSAIRPSSKIDRQYLIQFLKHHEPILAQSGVGSTFKAITQADLNNIDIPFPPLEEQKRIAAILDSADAIRTKRKAAIAKLDELAQSIFLDMFGDPVKNPNQFPIRCLKDFYINERDGTKCGPFGSALKKEEYKQKGIPVWNMDNISCNGKMNDSFNLWIDESKYAELLAYSVNNGDVLISRAGTVGKMCVVNTEFKKSIISTNLIRVRFGEKLIPDYFVNLMTYCKDRIAKLKKGQEDAFSHMNTGILDTINFPYPPLDLQKKYIDRIKVLEKLRSVQTKTLSYDDLLFSSLQQRAFAGEL